MDKESIRRKVLSKRASLSPEEFKLKSRAVKARLFNCEEFRRARVIHFYVAFKNEVDTEEMIKAALEMGKCVVIPRVNHETNELELSELKDFKNELRENRMGIKEPAGPYIRPVEPQKVQLMIIPGVAFDLAGNRIGFGKGYYDRLLKKCESAFVAGLAYEFQVLEFLPAFDHDVKIDKIVTENRTIDIPLRRPFGSYDCKIN